MSTTNIPFGLQPVPTYAAAPAIHAASAGAAANSSAPSHKLIASAHEFEAQMMKELLAPLSSTGMGDEDSEQGAGGALTSYASEALGRALSNGGGFGIADRIIHSLSHSGTKN